MKSSFRGDGPSWWEVRVVPLRIQDKLASAMVILKDITEQRMLRHTLYGMPDSHRWVCWRRV